MEVTTELCRLRPWRMEDAPALTVAMNNPAIWWVPDPYTLDDANTWLQSVIDSESESAVCLEVDGKVAGGMSVRFRSGIHRRTAELGYWLDEPLWGRGIMTAAVRAFTPACLQAFDLARIFATTSSNPASTRVLEKAGFVFEGRLRKNVVRDGRDLDSLLFAFVREDAPAAR